MTTIIFDLETQNAIDEVGGRAHLNRLLMSVGVTLALPGETVHRYTEDNVADLVSELRSADRIVGFNLIDFDYPVLSAYTDEPLDALPTVDIMAHVRRSVGFRVGLDALASATLNVRKTGHGLQAIAWWREGRLEDLFTYCEQDVAATRQLYEFGRANRYVQFYDRNYRLRRVPVSW